MRLVLPTALTLALAGSLFSSPALANGPHRQLGETLEVRSDGQFQRPAFHVIRSEADLDRVFKGAPPRIDIDFSKGPVLLYAGSPGQKAPVIVDVASFQSRLDVRVKTVDGSLLPSTKEGASAGAPYHMVQLAAPGDASFRLSVAESAKIKAKLVVEGDSLHFQQLHRYTERQAVRIVERVGRDRVVVSPEEKSYVKGEIPSAWIARVEGSGDLRPGARAIVQVPAGETMNLPGSFRLHPTDPELIDRLRSAEALHGRIMELDGDFYKAIPYRDHVVDVHRIDPLRPGKSPVTVGSPDDAALVASTFETVFPVKPRPQVAEEGLSGAPVVQDTRLARGSETQTDEASAEQADEVALADDASPESTVVDDVDLESESTAMVKTEDADAQADEAGPLASTADGSSPSLVGAVSDVSKEIQASTEAATPEGEEQSSEDTEESAQVSDTPDLASSQPMTKAEGEEQAAEEQAAEEQAAEEQAAEEVVDAGEESSEVSDTPDLDTSEPLAKTAGEEEEQSSEEDPSTVVDDGPSALEGEPVVKTEAEQAQDGEQDEEEVASTVAEPTQEQDEEEVASSVSDAGQAQENEQEQEVEEVFPWKGTVNVSELNVRDAPRADATGLLVYLQGTEVEVVGRDANGWLLVKVPQLQGYVNKRLIDFPAGKGKKGGPATVNLSFINLRSQASSNSKVVVMLRQNFPLTVRRTGHRGSWLRVTSAGEMQAFVNGCYVDKQGE
jgi:hypothetical protein